MSRKNLSRQPQRAREGPDGRRRPRAGPDHRTDLRLDPARAGADRPLAEEHERPDLGARLVALPAKAKARSEMFARVGGLRLREGVTIAEWLMRDADLDRAMRALLMRERRAAWNLLNAGDEVRAQLVPGSGGVVVLPG